MQAFFLSLALILVSSSSFAGGVGTCHRNPHTTVGSSLIRELQARLNTGQVVPFNNFYGHELSCQTVHTDSSDFGFVASQTTFTFPRQLEGLPQVAALFHTPASGTCRAQTVRHDSPDLSLDARLLPDGSYMIATKPATNASFSVCQLARK